MTDLDGQEREALEEAKLAEWELGYFDHDPSGKEIRCYNEGVERGFMAALTAREEPVSDGAVSVETQRRYLNDAEFHARVELAREQALSEGVRLNRALVLVVVNALDRAREDTERPDERETAWAAWLASWEAEPGDEDAFVAWWESYSRASQASRQLPLAAREEPPGGIEQKLRDALADALLWLERIPPPEEEIRALGRGLWDETLENARALLAAREDAGKSPFARHPIEDCPGSVPLQPLKRDTERPDDGCSVCGSHLIGSCTLPECPNPLVVVRDAE